MQPTLDLIGIVATDMAASLSFYRRLGVPFPEAEAGAQHVEATLPGGIRIALDSAEVIRSFEPDWQPLTGSAPIALAFKCESPAAVDETYASLVASGAASANEPWDAPWGMRYARLSDPDGNSIDLFANL